VSADNSPLGVAFTGPDTSVAVSTAAKHTGYLHREARAQGGHRDVPADATHLEFLGQMLAKANGRRRMRL
jgi:hypothetical protein